MHLLARVARGGRTTLEPQIWHCSKQVIKVTSAVINPLKEHQLSQHISRASIGCRLFASPSFLSPSLWEAPVGRAGIKPRTGVDHV